MVGQVWLVLGEALTPVVRPVMFASSQVELVEIGGCLGSWGRAVRKPAAPDG